MVYCKDCQRSLSWPVSDKKEQAVCEVCKLPAECFNLPDNQLHDPRAV